MCGIFGWVIERSKSQRSDLLIDLTDLLTHRGPDGSGYWMSHTADESFQLAFGHRRLSIIDIAGGAQPMWSEDGSLALIFNGEIYNYIELRELLRVQGHVFHGQSDTEVLLAAYRQWDVAALKRLRGMFAFALWDNVRQRLILARDAFGKKPLFLAEPLGGSLVFGSEVQPLIAFPGVDRRCDEAALGQYFLSRYVPGPRTFFRGIRKLQPGCYAIWANGKLETTRYFTPPLGNAAPDIADFEQARELFEKTFDDAVRIRMRSDAPYGAFLSGGIDSSAVVAAMVRHSEKRVKTFSVGFHESTYSELDHARAVAKFFETDHHELVITPDEFMKHWLDAVRHRGAPVSEASDIPIFLLSRFASSNVKMVLTGEGADELLAGYPKHRAEPWIERYQGLVPALMHERIVAPLVFSLPYGLRRIKIGAAAAGERNRHARLRLWFGGMSAAERDAMLSRPVSEPAVDSFPYGACGSNLRRTLFFDQTSWLPDNLLERGDRMMMAGSIEGRMPFMDTELAGVVARFPDRFLLGRKGGKAVLRSSMDGLLPAKIVKRKKIGFRVPIGEWFRGPYSDFLQELLLSSHSRVGGFCRASVLQRLVSEHANGRHNHERLLWALTNLEIFLREFMPSGLDEFSHRVA